MVAKIEYTDPASELTLISDTALVLDDQDLQGLFNSLNKGNSLFPIDTFVFTKNSPTVYSYVLTTKDGRSVTQNFDFTTEPLVISLTAVGVWRIGEIDHNVLIRNFLIRLKNKFNITSVTLVYA